MVGVDELGGTCISGERCSAGPSDWVSWRKVRAKVAPWSVSGIPQWPLQTGTGQMRRDALPSPPTGGALMCSCWAPGSDNQIKWREWKESFGRVEFGRDFKFGVVGNNSAFALSQTSESQMKWWTGSHRCLHQCMLVSGLLLNLLRLSLCSFSVRY